MPTLIREIRRRRDGTDAYTDRELAGRTLSVGSQVDQDIQLEGVGIAPEHAAIAVGKSRSVLRCRGRNKVVMGGTPAGRAVLVPGTEISIGGHRLVAILPPPGFELAIEVRFGDGLKPEDFEKTFSTHLNQTWLRRRPVAWLAAAFTLAAFLVVPLWLAQQRNAGNPLAPAAARWLPSDHLWSSEPLVPAHQLAIGDNCGACHQKLFQPVQDHACIECHKSVHDHVTPEHLALTRFAKTTPTCESCHREHQNPASAIIVRDNALCVSCHGRATADFGTLKVETVRAFDDINHPKFKIRLLQPVPDDPLAGTPDAQWRYVAYDLDKARESSNLIFSHKQHLDAARVSANSHDGALVCGDCHVADADGLRFRKITMRNACISCHELTFDPLEPRRQLPHGKPREVVATIEEFYARRFLEPNSVPTRTFHPREVPGEADKVDAIKCTESAATCAQRAALAAIESQFTVRGCRGCHQISDNKSQVVEERFQVLAVRLGNEFYPHATFKHSSHLIQGDLTADAACKSCHGAERADDSSQVLIPGIDKCLTCHTDVSAGTPSLAAGEKIKGGASARTVVPLGCVGCHVYHPPVPAHPDPGRDIAAN